MHGEMPMENKKMKSKVTGYNIKILDDGTYLLTIENYDYSKSKQYSYEDMEDLFEDIKNEFPDNNSQDSNDEEDEYKAMAKKKVKKMMEGEEE